MKLSNSEKSRLLHKYGPWAIVTGASSGIGLELSTLLASSGLNLVLHGRDQGRLQKLSKKLEEVYQIETLTIACDLFEKDGTRQIIEMADGLPIGLLILSAGFGTSGSFIESSLSTELNMLEVNCRSLLQLTHHYSNQFALQKSGGIILLSSMVAFQGTPFSAHYAATKAYVQTLAEGLCLELKGQGVDVLAAAPGPVITQFGSRADLKMGMAMNVNQVAVPILKALGRKMTVLPGSLTKLLVYSLRLLPRWGKVVVMKKVMGGMTNHH